MGEVNIRRRGRRTGLDFRNAMFFFVVVVIVVLSCKFESE